jgi:hypothetical protein
MTRRYPALPTMKELTMSLLCRLSTGTVANLCVERRAWQRVSPEHSR